MSVPTLDRAKEQVEILIRIGDERLTFFHRNQVWPTQLYIGQEDFYDLLREADPSGIQRNPVRYRGMEIFRVDRAHHLKVC